MLQLERPVLNIVGRLSGISTGTRRYHEGIIHTHTHTHAHKGGISTSTRRYHEAS